MNEVEYVLRLVLKARDDMSAVLAKARTELIGFKGDADDLEHSLEDVNKRMKTFSNNVRNARTELAQLKQASDQTGGSVRLVTVAQGDLADATDRVASSKRDLSEADRRSLEASQRSLRSSQEQAAASKTRTNAVRTEAQELIRSGAARKYAIENLKLEASAATRASEELTKLKKERAEAVKNLSSARAYAGPGIPRRGELSDEARALIESANPEHLKRLDDLQAKVTEAKQKEAEQQRITQDARKSEIALIEQAADILAGNAVKEVAAEEKTIKAKDKSTAASKRKTAAKKEEAVAEEVSTKATAKAEVVTDKEVATKERSTRASRNRAKALADETTAEETRAAKFREIVTGEQQAVDTSTLPRKHEISGRDITVTGVHSTPRIEDYESIKKSGFRGGTYAYTDEAFAGRKFGTFPGAEYYHQIPVEAKIRNALTGTDREIYKFINDLKARFNETSTSAAVKKAGYGGFVSAEGRVYVVDSKQIVIREGDAVAKSDVAAKVDKAVEKTVDEAVKKPTKPKKVKKQKKVEVDVELDEDFDEGSIAKDLEDDDKLFEGIVDDQWGKIDDNPINLSRHVHIEKSDYGDPYSEQGYGNEDFGGGMFGGGAPRKSEVEAARQRDRIALHNKERNELRKSEVEYELARGALSKFLGAFKQGDIDVDTFIEKLKGFERQTASIRTRLARLSTLAPRQLQNLMDAPGVIREQVDVMTSGKNVDAGDREKILGAIGKSGVAGDAGQEERAVTGATEALKKHSAALDDNWQEAAKLRDRMHALYADFDRGKIDAEDAADAINDIGNSLGQLRRRESGSPVGITIGRLARDAKDAAEAIRNDSVENERGERSARRNAEAHAALTKEADNLFLGYSQLMREVRAGNVHWITARNQVTKYADDMQRVSRRLSGIDPSREIQLGEAVSNARKEIQGFNRDGNLHIRTVQNASRAQAGLTGWLNKMAEGANRAGGSVAKVDNELRGMLVLAVIAFAQQFITLIDAAAGALGSFASSAIFAAGAVGGALVAGIAQALPMVGLLAASFLRVKGVMQAVQQQQLVQQQQFQRAAPQTKKQADTSDALANAEDGVKSAEDGVTQAHQRLADAQRGLTQARIDARQQLRDLIAAERDAELQARGAALAQGDAQEALRQAVATGDVGGLSEAELRVSEAQQSNREAQQKLSDTHAEARRRIPQGVEGQDNVRQARRQVEDAKRGVTQAAEAVVKANRQMEKAQRGADAATADQFAGLQKLNFLLQKQLSPAERELYDRIQKFRKVYAEQFRPVTDILIRQYTKGVDSAISLLKNPGIINAAHGLATGMAREMSRIRKSFTDAPSIDQFERIVKSGQRNLPAVGKIARNIGHALLNIAEEAAPALHRIINWFKELSDRILGVTENRGKMASFFSVAADHAIAWMNALESIVKLLAALAGIGQSEGLSMVQEITKWANDATNNVNSHRSEVAKFFKESHDTLKIFLQFVGEVAKAMLDVYSPSRLRPFAEFLGQVLLPALVSAMKLVGAVTALFLKILSLPVISQGARIALTVLVITKLVTSLRTLFTMLMSNFAQFSLWADKLSGGQWNNFFVGLGNAAKGAGRNLSGVVTAIGDLLRKIPLLKNTRLPGWFTAKGEKLGGLQPTTPGTPVLGQRRPRPGEPGVPGAPGAGGPTYVGGRPREPWGGYPGEPGTPDVAGDVTPRRPRSRLRSIGRGVGIGALVGAGAYGLTRGQAGDLHDITRKSGIGVATDELSGLAQNITSFNFGGAIKQIFGSTTASDLKKFVGSFDEQLQRLTKKRDTTGLQELSDKARDLAKEFPLYADALNAAADQADNSRVSTKQLNDRLKDTQGISAWFRHNGINIDIKTRGGVSPEQLQDLKWYLQELRRGAPTSFRELTGQVHDEVQRINDAFAQGGVRTPAWFDAMGKTYSAAIDNIKRLHREGKISAADARDQIGKLQDDLKLFKSQNPLDIGADFVKSIVSSKGNRKKAIEGVIDDLKKMPPAARAQAAAMTIEMVNKMAKAHPELRDAAKQVRYLIGSQIRTMRDANIKRTWEMTQGISGLINALPAGVGTAIKGVGSALNSALTALGIGRVKFDIPHAGKAAVNLLGGNIPGAVQALLGGGGDGGDRAVGGRVGKKGMRGKDTRPTWLGDGELVLNHWHEAAVNSQLPGQQTVGDIVERIRGFHAGSYGDNIGFAQGGYALGGVHAGVRKAALAVLSHFPQLMVTSTTGGGHAANSYHYRGEAVDLASGDYGLMNRAARWIARSSLARSLAEGIHNPGLSIKNGRSISPGFWGATTWGNHANHIHLAVAGAIGDIIGGVAQHVKRAVVHGPAGGVKKLLQGVMDKAVRAANRKIDREQGSASGGGDYSQQAVRGGMGRAAVAGVINRAMQIVGIPQNIRASWRSMALSRSHQESGWNPNAQNNWDSNAAKGDPSRGLFQTIGSTFNAYKVRGHNNILAPLDNTIAAFRYMLAAYGRGSWALALSRMLGRAGVGYATGGPVPGYGGGDRHPAMLEGGEHVFTKEEVKNAGGHDILFKLRQLLGGGKQGGPIGYATGGQVDDNALNRPYTTAADLERRRNALRGRYVLPVIPIRDWDDLLKEVKRAMLAVKRVATTWKGRIHEINVEIQKIRDTHDREVKKEISDLKKGGVTKSEAAKIRKLRDEELDKQDKATVKQLQEERTDLRKNTHGIRRRFETTRRRSNLLANVDAITREGGLLDTMTTVRERVSAQRQRGNLIGREIGKTGRYVGQFLEKARGVVVNRYDAQDIANNNLDNSRADLSGIEKQEGVINDSRKAVQKELARLRKGGVTGKEAATVRRLETQLSKLRDDYDQIRDAHAAALQAVYEAEQAAQQAAIDGINKRAENATNANEHWRRIWTALGNNDLITKVNEAQRNILTKQADDLAAQIPKAAAMGNTELVDQLTQQVQDLRDTVFENLQQELADSAERINQAAQRRMGRLDLFGRMQSALGKLGLNSVVGVGGEQFSAAGIHQQQQATLEGQRTQLQTLLQRVMSESPMNVQLIQSLTDQLAELDTTIQENTKAWFNTRVQDVNDRFGRANTTLDLRKQIIELTGALPGNTVDTAAELEIERQRTVALQAQAAGLQELLNEAIANQDDQAINDLSDQLLQNQIATLQNTQAINDLTGATTQPQGFQSSSWEWFRQAIFSGMGDVLPQYIVPGAATGGIVTKSGLAMVHSGEPIVPAHIADAEWGGGGGDTFNFEINEAGGPIDLTELASTVAWAKKTAQTTRK